MIPSSCQSYCNPEISLRYRFGKPSNVYNNNYRISRKSRNWLSAIRGIRYLRYLSVISSMIDNQALGQNVDIPTDTFSAIFKHSQKSAETYHSSLIVHNYFNPFSLKINTKSYSLTMSVSCAESIKESARAFLPALIY